MAKKQPVKITKPDYSDDNLGKEIEIKCQGSDVIAIDELTAFQGNLKKLSESSYKRLKHSILTLGFSFPVSAWKYRNKVMILDAHQRVSALLRMREEGFVIPKLPVVWIEAKDQQEAARKVLAATSQYGEIQTDGLSRFMEEFKLEIPEIEESFRFPEINFDAFGENYLTQNEAPIVIGDGLTLDLPPQEPQQKVKVSEHERKKVDLDSYEKFDHKCPECGHQF